jgi:hypothetical protein
MTENAISTIQCKAPKTKTLAYRLGLALDNGNVSAAERSEWLHRRPELQVSTELAQGWLNGDKTPSPSHIEILADLLVVDTEWLESGTHPDEHTGTFNHQPNTLTQTYTEPGLAYTVLQQAATRQISHLDAGHCPGPDLGSEARDTNCMVCSALVALGI